MPINFLISFLMLWTMWDFFSRPLMTVNCVRNKWIWPENYRNKLLSVHIVLNWFLKENWHFRARAFSRDISSIFSLHNFIIRFHYWWTLNLTKIASSFFFNVPGSCMMWIHLVQNSTSARFVKNLQYSPSANSFN